MVIEIETIVIKVIMVKEIRVHSEIAVAVEAVAVEAVAVEAVAVEAVAVEAVAVEAVAVEAVVAEAVVAEAVAAEAVAVEAVVADALEILKEITQVMVVEVTSLTVVKHVVKITNLPTRLVKVTKVGTPKVEGITEVEVAVVDPIEEEAVIEIDYSSSSTFLCFIGENMPLSSMISLAPGRIDRISSVISPVFL
jgi:hypothetical protein